MNRRHNANLKLYLHIGWHKTGTTSIQQFLLTNQQKLIAEEKIYYPAEGLVGCAHHTIAWVLQNRAVSPMGERLVSPDLGTDSFLNEIIGCAHQHNCNKIIISSEDFCTLQPDEIKQLANVIQHHQVDVKIIAYLRRQDEYLESAYNTQVKWWATRYKLDFSDYCNSHTPNINYFSVIEEWGKLLGADNIILKPFSQEKLLGGDIRKDFCNALDINWAELKFRQEKANRSLAPQTLEFLRILNNLEMPKEEHLKVIRRLLEYDKSEKLPKCVLFTPTERVSFMNMLAESNKALGKYNKDLGLCLSPDKSLPDKNIKSLTNKEFDKIFQFVFNGKKPIWHRILKIAKRPE